MNSEHLKARICDITWLENAGEITDLIKSEPDWEWLPTTRDCSDPFGCSYSRSPEESEVYKLTLKSLRNLGGSSPILVDGPHDYTNAFKGAALYAFKMAARELSHNSPGKWVNLVSIYESGRWPLGITNSGEIIVL